MRARLALTAAAAGGLLLAGTGTATAQEPTDTATSSYGPEWQPGPDYTNFEPGPDYTNFEPDPDQSEFEPGYAPGTADLVEDPLAGLLQQFTRGLFGR